MNMEKMLQDDVEIANVHSARLHMAYDHLKSIFPLTPEKVQNFSDEELGFLEILTSRFAKLQDLIGQRIFPKILQLLEENPENLSFLDRLNKLEKLGFLPSSDFWKRFREVRNSIAHDYPNNPKLMAQQINSVIDTMLILLSYWKKLESDMQEREWLKRA